MMQWFNILKVYEEVMEMLKRHHVEFITLRADDFEGTVMFMSDRATIYQTIEQKEKGICDLIISEGFFHELHEELLNYYLEPEM